MQTKVSQTYRFWKAWITIHEMLKDRKKNVPEENFMSYEDFEAWIGDADTDPASARKEMFFNISGAEGEQNGGIAVFWKESLGTSDVQEIDETLKSLGIKHAIAIHNNKVTPYAAYALRSLRVQKVIIEVFTESELQYNVTKHEYVPKHIICSSKTKEEILTSYSVDTSKIVKISCEDPVIRYLGAVKGQLIKIVRPSDSIPYVDLPAANGEKERKFLYDISYKIVA